MRSRTALEDFSTQIAAFKKAGAEIGTGIFIPPDFTNFWKQSAQQGWKPKIATYTKALLFPQSVEALGSIANGLTTEVWWSPNHPFTSPLLNQTCKEFAADFETTQNQQWTQPLLHFLVFDWAADVLKRTTSVDDKNAIITAVAGDQDGDHRREDRLHRSRAAGRSALETRPVPYRAERLQVASGPRPVAQGDQVPVRPDHHRQRDRPGDSGGRQDPAVHRGLAGIISQRR